MPDEAPLVLRWLAALFVLATLTSAAAPPAGYVNPAQCAACHAAIAKSYGETGMGRSFYRPGPSTVPAGAKFYHQASDRYYEFTERGGALHLVRYQKGFGGAETNRVEKSIDYVLGSGNGARTYVHRNAAGRLIELPVGWYSENGGTIAMSPGYDNPKHEDFRREVAEDCLFCHNAYPRPGAPVAGGIDCQRCHGPGAAHVAAAGSGKASPAQIRAAIVNPAGLNRDRQLDVCMQCHLEPTSLPLPHAIRKYDREPYSFTAGQALTAYQNFFDMAPGSGFEDRFEVAHHAYRLRKSACFRASAMTCTTCHNPHRAPRGQAAVDRYVAACRGCHPGPHPATVETGGATCLDCHMWKRRPEDAVHTVMTDHFIQRRKPGRDLTAPLAERPLAYRGEVIAYYPERPENELYLSLAQVKLGSNLEAGIDRLKRALTASNPPAAPEFYLELGKAQSKAGRTGSAIQSFEEALRRRPGYRDALRELAATLALAGEWTRAVDTGERACAQQPPDAIALTNLGNAHLRAGRPDRARPVLERALAANPDSPEARNLLGMTWLATKNQGAAEQAFRVAIAIQPDAAEPHSNLANLLAGGGNYPEAAYHLQKAIDANPDNAEAHHSYGLLLVLMKEGDGALRELAEAARLSPAAPQPHADYADILLGTGKPAEAESEYRVAIRLDSRGAEAYYGLGNALMARQQTGEAIRAYQSAVERNADLLEAHLALGTALARAGNAGAARAHFERAARSPDAAVRAAALRELR